MKKVLLGLVITVMMTGSGYGLETSEQDGSRWMRMIHTANCKYLVEIIEGQLVVARIAYKDKNNYKEEKALKKVNSAINIYSAWCD